MGFDALSQCCGSSNLKHHVTCLGGRLSQTAILNSAK